MASKVSQEYILKVVVEGLDGVVSQLKVMNTQLNTNTKSKGKNSKATKEQNTQTDHFLKQSKGVIGATSSGTKAFSKMTDGLTGGLVPAYAAVAANIFAITAAFGALERAADFQVMIDSAEALTTQTGRSLTTLSKEMQSLTGNAISMKEAMTSASIAASAGFDDSTIKNLTTAARNASVALGRDMTDSLNRVFKGAIKAEPELLDELGIILRLEPATKKYAAAIGKSVKDLTTFEKQQAIVNEVIDQAEEKFGLLANVDTNVYTQLASNFTDITTAMLGFINILAAPVLSLFVDNIELLAIGVLLLVKSIASLAIPQFQKLGSVIGSKLTGSIESMNKSIANTKTTFQGIQESAKFAPDLELAALVLDGRFQDLDASSKDFGKSVGLAFDKLQDGAALTTQEVSSLQGHLNQLGKRGISGFSAEDVDAARLTLKSMQEELVKVEGQTNPVVRAFRNLFRTIKLGALNSAIVFTETMRDSSIEVSRATGVLGTLKAAYLTVGRAAKVAEIGANGFTKAMQKIGRVGGAITGSIAAIGGKLLSFLPTLGALTLAWGLFTDALHALSATDLSSAMATQEDALKSAKVASEAYVESLSTLPGTLDALNKRLTTQANIMQSISSSLTASLDEIAKQDGFDWMDNLLDFTALGSFDQFKDNLEATAVELDRLGNTTGLDALLESFGGINEIIGLNREDSIKFAKELKNLTDSTNASAQGAKEAVLLLSNSFDSLDKNLNKVTGSLPSLNAIEATMVDLGSILSQVESFSSEELVSGLSRLSDVQLTELGFGNQIDESIQYSQVLTDLKKRAQELAVELDNVNVFQPGRRDDLIQEIAAIGEGMSQVSQIMNRFGDEAKAVLEGTEQRLITLVDAQKRLNDTQLEVKIQSAGNPGLIERLTLTEKLTAAQLNYLSVIRESDEATLNSARTTLTDLNSKLASIRSDRSLTDDQKKAEIAPLEQRRLSTLTSIEKLEKKLTDTRGKAQEEQLKFVQELDKSLRNTFKFQDSEFFNKQASDIKGKLIPAVAKLTAGLTAGSPAKVFIDGLVAELDAAGKRAKALFEAGFATTGSTEGDINKVATEVGKTTLDASATSIEISLNEQLSGQLDDRLDKEFLISTELLNRQIIAADSSEDYKFQVALTAKLAANAKLATLSLKQQGIALIKNAKAELEALKATSTLEKQILDTNLKLAKAQGLDDSQIKEYTKVLEETVKVQNQLDFTDQLKSAAGAMNELADAMGTFAENTQNAEFDQTANAMILLQSISAEIDNEFGKIGNSLATVGLGLQAYNAEAERIDNSDLTVAQKEAASLNNNFSLVANSMSGIAGAFEEGTSAAKAFTAVAQLAAIANAANAVAVAAASGGPFGLANAAAMLSLLGTVLGGAGIVFGGSSEVQTVTTGEEQRDFGNFGLRGPDNQESIALVDSLADLVSINTKLFSAERELQLSVNNLNTTFLSLVGDIVRTINLSGIDEAFTGTTSSTGVFNNDNASNLQTNISVANELRGLELGLEAEIGVITNTLVGQITDAFIASFIQSTRTETFDFGGNTLSNQIDNLVEVTNLDDALVSELQAGLDSTLQVVNDSLTLLDQTIGIDIGKLLEGFNVSIANIQLDLFETDAADVTESIAAFFSNISDSIFERLLPSLADFSLAGEEFTDIIARISSNTIQIGNAFNLLGQDLASTINAQAFTDLYFQPITTQELQDAAASNIDLTSVYEEFASLTAEGAAEAISSIYEDAGIFDIEAPSLDAQAEAFKINAVAAWEAALLSNFKDIEEFKDMFTIFTETIFDKETLAQTAVDNAQAVLNDALLAIESQISGTGFEDLGDILSGGIDATNLREFYETAIESGAFFDEAGANLEATVIQSGVAVAQLDNAVADLADALDNLNQKYLRQIEAFGLLGKELDLLLLSFDFEDALIEATETGTDISLVEKAFGLERLAIIKQYNEDISNSIIETFDGIANSILDISRSFDAWDEVIFQSVKIDNIARRLANSLSGVDLSLFNIDDSAEGVAEFVASFEDIFNFSAANPQSIEDQIDLVKELEDSIVSRYELETNAIIELNDKLSSLAIDIRNFLNDLLLDDLSPLTNTAQLEEARRQFTDNLENALSTDTELADLAQSNLLSSATSLLEQASLFSAIGPQYQAIFEEVFSSLENLGIDLDALGITTEQQTLNRLDDIRTATIDQLDVLDAVLMQLETANAAVLESDILDMGVQITTHLGFIVDKLESINDESWAPLLEVIRGLDTTTTSSIEPDPVLDVLNNLNSFGSGTADVEYDQLAMIHKGEAILRPEDAANLRDGSLITNGAVSSQDNSEVVAAITTLIEVVAGGNEDLLEQSEKIEQATIDNSHQAVAIPVASTKGII